MNNIIYIYLADGGGAAAVGMRFGGSAHMKQGNRLEDLSLPTLICPPSCDCATAACVRTACVLTGDGTRMD